MRERRDGMPFAMTMLFVIASFLTLAVLFRPHMTPYQVTVADAAARDKTLAFLFWGAGAFVLPVIVIIPRSSSIGCSAASFTRHRAVEFLGSPK